MGKNKLKKELILSGGYLLALINMILGIKIYPIEWSFLFFVLLGAAFYFFRIDSRFLIFPAIFLLGYCPFLLIADNKILAENMAIYAYYFLVAGVLVQIVEFFKKREVKLEFKKTLSRISKKINSSKLIVDIGFITIFAFLIDLFIPLFNQLKYTSLYFLIVSIVFYTYKKIKYNSHHCTY